MFKGLVKYTCYAIVIRWNRIPARKWGAGAGQCFAGTGFPQENGALEPDRVSLEPDSRKKMGRWNRTVFRWNRIPARKWGAGTTPRLEL